MVRNADRGRFPLRRRVVAGPADRYADTLTTGHPHGVPVDPTWLGARRLLGLPLQELACRNLAVEEVWGREGRLLLDRLAGTRSPGARLDLVEGFLANGSSRPPWTASGTSPHAAALAETWQWTWHQRSARPDTTWARRSASRAEPIRRLRGT